MNILKKIANRLLLIKNKTIQAYLNAFVWKKEKYKIDLDILFEDLKQYEYALIKVDTPYTSIDFPKSYPIGKDMDMFCTKRNFEDINNVLKIFANKYNDKFDIRIINENDKYRIRLEKYGQLYYQLDNYYLTDNSLSSVFIDEAIQNRVKLKNYFTLEKKYEIIFRLSEIKETPTKKHHIDYVINNIENADIELIKINNLDDIFNNIMQNK